MVEDFKAFVDQQATPRSKKTSWTKDLEFIKAMIRFEIDTAVFDIATARQHLIDRQTPRPASPLAGSPRPSGWWNCPGTVQPE